MVDDREFLADFLDKPSVETNDDMDNETVELGIEQIPRDMVIDQTEMSSLYYIAGYCIRKVNKSNTHYPSCLLAIEAKQSSLTAPLKNLYS